MIDFRIRRVESRHRDGTVFISPKTVSVHVSALLRKFGVSGRGEFERGTLGRVQAAALTSPCTHSLEIKQIDDAAGTSAGSRRYRPGHLIELDHSPCSRLCARRDSVGNRLSVGEEVPPPRYR